MATWQFDVELVPRSNVQRGSEEPHSVQRNEDYWKGETLPDGYREHLDGVLPRRSTWTQDLEGWGTEDGNRLDVLRSGGKVEECRARIDAREIDVGFLEALIRFAGYSGCVLLTEEGELIEPLLDELMREIRSSTPHRFVVDPKTFLDSLSSKEKPPGFES